MNLLLQLLVTAATYYLLEVKKGGGGEDLGFLVFNLLITIRQNPLRLKNRFNFIFGFGMTF